MRVVLVCLAVALCFGCGYKDELERQKQQVDRMHSEVQRLSETLGSLEKEKTRLGDDLKVLADKNASLQTEVADLKKAKDSSEADNAKLRKRNSELQDELDSLKRQKTDLEREVGELNKKLSESPPPQGSSQAQPPGSGPQAVPGKVSSGPPPPNPCDTVIVFMKQSAQIIKQNKGNQRTKRLAQLKQELAKSMEGAPPKAVKSAEAWVNELSATWDKRNDDSVYKLLTLRNAALEACGMKPQEVGF
jgi:phage-related tail protein